METVEPKPLSEMTCQICHKPITPHLLELIVKAYDGDPMFEGDVLRWWCPDCTKENPKAGQ